MHTKENVNKLYYSGIEPCDVLNGEGFRTVIWVSGCSMGCKGCFNPSTHNPYYGQEYTQETENYLLECLSKDYIDGVTITGGNPLEDYNLDTVLNLVNRIRLLLPNKTIWLYSGYTVNIYEQYNCDHTIIETTPQNNNENDFKREDIIRKCNVVVDGRYIDAQRDTSLRWRGSKNQRVIDVQESLQQGKVVLYCD